MSYRTRERDQLKRECAYGWETCSKTFPFPARAEKLLRPSVRLEHTGEAQHQSASLMMSPTKPKPHI